jgi:hypothetical protein
LRERDTNEKAKWFLRWLSTPLQRRARK